ncbi:MAG: hypothetical protein ACTSQY_00840 [Candidatus Odinarchaeia archaeon]
MKKCWWYIKYDLGYKGVSEEYKYSNIQDILPNPKKNATATILELQPIPELKVITRDNIDIKNNMNIHYNINIGTSNWYFEYGC